MIFLLLAIISSALIAILMRISSKYISANLSMLAINYFVCALLGVIYTGFHPVLPGQSDFLLIIGLAIFSGFLYLGGFVLFQRNTHKNGVVLSSVFMKLGLLVPVTVSILAFHETPSINQIFGFCIAIFAILLINLKKEQNGKGFGIGLILMLLMCGGCDAMSKVVERLGFESLGDSYLFYTFLFAFLLCVMMVLHKKEKPRFWEMIFGTLIGIPNFFSAKFLLASLTKLPGVIAYPSFSVGTILIVTLVGVIAFREKLTKREWCGLTAIIVSLILLNI